MITYYRASLQYLWITFYGLAQMTMKQTIFQSYVQILPLVKKIIVFRYTVLRLEQNDSRIPFNQMNYLENLKLIASNYNESNSKDLLIINWKVVMDE